MQSVKKHAKATLRIEEIVANSVKKHVECHGLEWKRVQFSLPALKYRVVKDAIEASELDVTNVELTNLLDSTSLVELLKKKVEKQALKNLNFVELLVESKKENNKIGSNVAYLPKGRKKLILIDNSNR